MQPKPQMTVFRVVKNMFVSDYFIFFIYCYYLKNDGLSIRKLSGKVFIVFLCQYPWTQTILLKERKGNGIIFQYQMLVLIILRKRLFSQHYSGLAVQAPLDPGDITDMYWNSTFLWNSFMFNIFKDPLPFQAGILRKDFCHGNDVRCHFSSLWTDFRLVL
jgi:hypothetical protein